MISIQPESPSMTEGGVAQDQPSFSQDFPPMGEFFHREEAARVEAAIRANRNKFGEPKSQEGRLFEAVAIHEHLPKQRLQALWRQLLNQGVGAVGGLPTDPDDAKVAHLALSIEFGLCFNYAQQNAGDIVMELKPVIGSPDNTNTTNGEFQAHTDDAILRPALRTKWIALYGVVNPSNAVTGYALLDPVCASLPQNVVDVLSSPRFQVRVPISFGRGDNIWSDPRPVLFVDGNGERRVAIPTYAVRPADERDLEAKTALDFLLAAFASDAVWKWVSLDPGTFMIFDNDRGLHRRSAIRGERLIYRTYIRPELEELRRVSGTNGWVFSLDALGL